MDISVNFYFFCVSQSSTSSKMALSPTKGTPAKSVRLTSKAWKFPNTAQGRGWLLKIIVNTIGIWFPEK
jgi:hypothetical protein